MSKEDDSGSYLSDGNIHANRAEYFEELQRRLTAHARRDKEVAHEVFGSAQWLDNVGKFWNTARMEQQITREQLAAKLFISPDELAFFESGLIEPEIVLTELPQRYAATLGKPELYTEFCQKFGLPLPSEPPGRP